MLMDVEGKVQQIPNSFSGVFSQYDCRLHLNHSKLEVELVNKESFSKHTAQIDDKFLKDCKELDFFFPSISDLYSHLVSSFESIWITKNGALMFSMEVNLGSLLKRFECKIETNKHKLEQKQIFLMKTSMLDDYIQRVKLESQLLLGSLKGQIQEQRKLQLKIEEYGKLLSAKDEIIDAIVHEVKQMRKWKDDCQKKQEQKEKVNIFIIDEKNSHAERFKQIGKRIVKIIGGTWDILMNKIPVSKMEVTSYTVRQIRAGCSGSFMYGIGTEHIRGINRAQDSKYFIGYYELTGNVYQQGNSRKGGVKVKDGSTVAIVIDPLRWKISWYIDGKKEVEASIGVQMRMHSLYLTCLVFNNEAQLEFI